MDPKFQQLVSAASYAVCVFGSASEFELLELDGDRLKGDSVEWLERLFNLPDDREAN
jgi:hypothetical protein